MTCRVIAVRPLEEEARNALVIERAAAAEGMEGVAGVLGAAGPRGAGGGGLRWSGQETTEGVWLDNIDEEDEEEETEEEDEEEA